MLLPLRARIYLKLSSGDFDLLLMNISYIPSGEYKLLPAQKGLGAARQKAETKTERQEPALVEKAASDIPGGVKRSRAGKVGEASCPLFTVRTAHRVSAHPLAQERHQTEVSSAYRHQLVRGAGAFVPWGETEGEMVVQPVGDKASAKTSWQPFNSYKGRIETEPAPPQKHMVGWWQSTSIRRHSDWN